MEAVLAVIDYIALGLCYVIFVVGLAGIVLLPFVSNETDGNPFAGLLLAIALMFIGGVGISTFTG